MLREVNRGPSHVSHEPSDTYLLYMSRLAPEDLHSPFFDNEQPGCILDLEARELLY